eukprot:scaffold8465_cov60-Phaeocystis_antarctica.AAC.8
MQTMPAMTEEQVLSALSQVTSWKPPPKPPLPGSFRPHCFECGATDTPKWRFGQTLCNACDLKRKEAPSPAAAAEVEEASPPATLVVSLARGCTASSRAATPAAPSGQSRGSALRACCSRSPSACCDGAFATMPTPCPPGFPTHPAHPDHPANQSQRKGPAWAWSARLAGWLAVAGWLVVG